MRMGRQRMREAEGEMEIGQGEILQDGQNAAVV